MAGTWSEGGTSGHPPHRHALNCPHVCHLADRHASASICWPGGSAQDGRMSHGSDRQALTRASRCSHAGAQWAEQVAKNKTHLPQLVLLCNRMLHSSIVRAKHLGGKVLG